MIAEFNGCRSGAGTAASLEHEAGLAVHVIGGANSLAWL